MNFVFLGYFPAEAISSLHNAQVFELRRMQTVRQGLNVLPNVGKALSRMTDVSVKIRRGFGRLFVPLLKFNRQ
jgi:hypothetical protein